MRIWGEAFGASDHTGPAIERFTNNDVGAVAGIDRHWGEFGTLGAAFGYAGNDHSMKAASSSASGKSYFGSLYGRWAAGGLLLDGGSIYGATGRFAAALALSCQIRMATPKASSRK